MQFIFQDPFASLNPRMTVYETLAEPLLLHGIESRSTVAASVLQLMDDVGLARAFARKYPHEFSGGQRQRIAIGRALATRPEFVVADEPVSALDVTIQAQILELMRELGREYGLTMLFISHDLAVVRQLADRIVVLQAGKVVEQASAWNLFEHPQQAYTRQLLQSIPGRSLMGAELDRA
jgi:peptide/nickel transport system ATP-binding protein/oligopeptide transport system ATP-binding protein